MLQENSYLDIEIINTIRDIPEEEWTRLFGKEIIEGYGYQKTLEESNLKGFTFRYLLVKNNTELVAIIPFFITKFSLTTLIRGPLQKIIFFMQKIFKNFLKMKIVFVGSPTTEYFYAGIAKKEDATTLMHKITNRLYRFCEDNKINALLFYNLTDKDKFLSNLLIKKGFARMKNFPATSIEIKAGSFQDYIAGLGKSTRKNLKRILKRASLMTELKTEIVENIDGIAEQIYKLYLNNFEESDVHFEVLTPDFFKNICHNMPGIAKFFITHDRKKIVAFNLCLINAKVCIDKFIGLDKNVAKKYHLYYTTFCHNLDWCIRNGINIYMLGQTDYDPKIRMGARLIPLYIYVKALNPILNFFAKPIIKLIEPSNYDPVLKKLIG